MHSQSCLIHLDDLSGLVVENNSQLESIACELEDSISVYTGLGFRVFDFGNYTLLDYFQDKDKIPQIINKAKTISNYYFIFINYSTSTGINSSGEIVTNIPLTLVSDSLTESDSIIIIQDLNSYYNGQTLSPNSSFAEFSTIKKFINILHDFKYKNVDNEKLILSYFKSKGSYQIPIGVSSNFRDTLKIHSRMSSNIEDNTNLAVKIGNQTFNLKDKMGAPLEDLRSYSNSDIKVVVTKTSDLVNTNKIDSIMNASLSCEALIYYNIDVGADPQKSILYITYLPSEEAYDEIVKKARLFTSACDNNGVQGSNLPKFQYKIVHRGFAPWDRFGDLLGAFKNSCDGDNRGFSNNYSATSRCNQYIDIDLSQDSSPIGYCDISNCKVDFVGPEKTDKGVLRSSGNYSSNRGLCIRFEGNNPLIHLSPDIDWIIGMTFDIEVNNGIKYLKLTGKSVGKGFPAYEAVLFDSKQNPLNLVAYQAPSESKLFQKLFLNWYDQELTINYKIEIDSKGNFLNNLYENGTLTNINTHNNAVLIKSPAQDCPSSPCTGEY